MAVAVHVAGAALIAVDVGAGLVTLGYTADGANIREETFFTNVPGDENGGTEGPPIDIQYFGEIHHVRLELTKYDTTVINAVLAKLKGGTAGVLGAAGTLMAGGAKTVRLLINAPTEPRNYLVAFLRNENEVNKATKFSRWVLEFECHANGIGGTIYNSTTT